MDQSVRKFGEERVAPVSVTLWQQTTESAHEDRSVSRGLGWFSIALGAAELFGSRRVTRAIGANVGETVVKAFEAREIAAGVALLQAPAHAARMWGRVAGDALDMGALALVARKSKKHRALIGAAAFVVGAALLDTIVARGLGRTPAVAANGAAFRMKERISEFFGSSNLRTSSGVLE